MGGAFCGDAFDAAINLSAGRGLLVDDRSPDTKRGRGRGGCQASGSRADDQIVESRAHILIVGLLGWWSMRMPSATVMRQAC